MISRVVSVMDSEAMVEMVFGNNQLSGNLSNLIRRKLSSRLTLVSIPRTIIVIFAMNFNDMPATLFIIIGLTSMELILSVSCGAKPKARKILSKLICV
jgi:Mg2+ and Co2+ transporter CorA